MTQTEAIVAAVAKALAVSGKRKVKAHKKKHGQKLTDAERQTYMARNDAECIEVFTKAGFSPVTPRVNVMTYGKWMAAGRKVKPGEKSHKVGGFALFHLGQTDELAPAAATVQ